MNRVVLFLGRRGTAQYGAAFGNLRQRVIRHLLEVARCYGREFVAPLSQQNLADRWGRLGGNILDLPALMRIVVPALTARDGRRQIHIVIHRDYADLAEAVQDALEGTEGAVVIVDRRVVPDRRLRRLPVPLDWRTAQRRRSAVGVADVVIEETGGGTQEP
jgi:hypothetical protein